MYSKPLASRMEGPREAPTKVKRGVPLGGSVNFSSFLPQDAGRAATAQRSGQSQEPSSMEQAATQGNLGLNQMRALAALTAANADTERSAPETGARAGMGLPLNPRDLFKLLNRSAPDTETAETAVRVKSHRKSPAESAREGVEKALTQKMHAGAEALRQKNGEPSTDVGRLAAQFESGSSGIAAIGYDRHGGTSYGKYQLSSRAGTMRKFITYLQTEAPDIAERLEKAGPPNTGGRRGKMPEAWQAVAGENPERFEELQDKFIRASHFEPVLEALVEKTGVAFADMPFALQEVVFSTAVQHGPQGASRIISRALGQVGQARLDPESNEPASLAKAQENLIRRIYDNRSGQFGSSTQAVQSAVKSRLRQEMSVAISMLREERAA